MPWRKLTELSRRAACLDQAIIQAEQENGRFDLVVSHLHKTDRIVSRCRHLDKDKTWFCLHGVFSASYLAHRQGFSLWQKKLKMRRVYQNRNIIGVSQYVVSDLKRSFAIQPKHEQIIFNPFDFDTVRAAAMQPCEMAGQPYLVHVGRFHQTKRHDRLLRAYAKTGISAPLVLIGQGTDEAVGRVKQLALTLGIQNRVIFKGFTDNPYPWISNAKLLVVSSDSEGFGNVLVEALICQVPIVSTRCPGGPVSIMTGELTRGLANLDVDSLADTIATVWSNPPDVARLDLEAYSIEAICKQYLALIAS